MSGLFWSLWDGSNALQGAVPSKKTKQSVPKPPQRDKHANVAYDSENYGVTNKSRSSASLPFVDVSCLGLPLIVHACER